MSVPTTCNLGDLAEAEGSRSPTSPQTMLLKVTELLQKNKSTAGAVIDGDERLRSVSDVNEDGKHHDPWSLPESSDAGLNWRELEKRAKFRVVVLNILKVSTLIGLLYIFVCSLDLLASAFRLIAARQAGVALSDSRLLQNPVAGLMIGVLATVLVQSSSTSSSIVVTMVASGILQVQQAIPIIMGANIGTSVTNTIVSLAQSGDRDQFRRAFAGATVHDMFNWMAVLVLLPLEIAVGYMYHVTSAIVSGWSWHLDKSATNRELLQTITKPLTKLIIQLDKNVIEGITLGDQQYANASLIKEWCADEDQTAWSNLTSTNSNVTNSSRDAESHNATVDSREVKYFVPVMPCTFLFQGWHLGDAATGFILLVISLFVICASLMAMVKLINSMLRGSLMSAAHRLVNAELPGRLAPLTGYAAMLAGAALTAVVQSSSVFTSMLTPLVGVGMVSLERVYPLTLGSNLGTTTTGLFAALAAPADRFSAAVQIALCHLLFNFSGILLFYPVPASRIPIRMARVMGDTTASYRWFAVVYLVGAFFAAPFLVFGLSMAGPRILSTFIGVVAVVTVIIVVINVLQKRRPYWLPSALRSWDRVPLWMRSLEPADRVMSAGVILIRRICSCCLERCCAEDDAFDDGILKAGVSQPSIGRLDHDRGRPTAGSSVHGTASRRPGNSRRSGKGAMLGSSGSSSASLLGVSKLRWGSVSSARPLMYGESESGYSSVASTPAPSRLPSYAVMEMAELENQDHSQQLDEQMADEVGPPRIVEMYIAEEDSDEENDDDENVHTNQRKSLSHVEPP